ncbi:MAG: IS66 family transposase [Firmicutes bacterium]|nr:IS66 family transposase [Bacillota bacterium]
MAKYTEADLNNFSKKRLVSMFLAQQEQLDRLNDNMERLIEQIRIMNSNRFGRKTEKLSQIDGQLSFFNEVEECCDLTVSEPELELVVRKVRKKKQQGQRELDIEGLPEEEIRHELTDKQLDEHFGIGCWRRIKSDEYARLRFNPASWTVERHSVDVAVGKSGDHQDEFLRGDRPKDLLRGSLVTHSLEAAIMNAKYVNSLPLARIEKEFERNGVFISRQTMANWTIQCSKKYLTPIYDLLHEKLLELDVNQCDETPVQVVNDNDPNDLEDIKSPAGHKNWMWVHRSGEYYTDRQIVLFEYQRGRGHEHPEAFYKGYNGVLVTDGLQQYHMLEANIEGLTNANCWVHMRRSFADAVKAIGKTNQSAIKNSVAYQALLRIATIYKLENTLKDVSPQERLNERQKAIKPLVEEYFAWVRERLADTSVLPKGKTADGLKYAINQEKYLKVFLTDGEVPIDNSASERALRTFTIGRKGWVLINSIKGAKASAVIYSITETAKLNGLNPYYYLDYLLTRMPELMAAKDKDRENPDKKELEKLLPWSSDLPEKCRAKRR